MVLRLILLLLFSIAAFPLFGQWVGGVEATSDTTYTYVTHYSGNPPWIFWQTASYLTYKVREGNVETTVSSPGVAAGATHRWSSGDTTAGLGAGYELRWTERRGFTDHEQGPVVEGDIIQRFASRTSGRVAARWSGANDWIAASAEIRQRLTRRLIIGPQAIWQGNDDVKVLSLGGFVEIPLGGNALQIRGGQARIEQADGSTTNEPYFSVGVVVPF
jgi:hypothetical protein